MRVSLKELQKAVGQALAQEKAIEVLREEITRVLGPSVVVDVDVNHLAENANDRIDVLERTGRIGLLEEFKPNALLKLVNHNSPEVRRLVARTIPDRYVASMKNDSDPFVRHAVAKRLPRILVKEMRQAWPHDDELASIDKQKKLNEAEEKPFDIYGDARMGDLARKGISQLDELSELWYQEQARKLISFYSAGMIDGQWHALAVKRLCSSMKSTNGVEVDEAKLYKEVMKQLDAKDDEALSENVFKDIARSLREEHVHELPQMIEESIDDVQNLLNANLSSKEYIKEASKIFNIKDSTMPASLRKYRVLEGKSREFKVPCSARTVGNRSITAIDEHALDVFVQNWNSISESAGELIKIDWSVNPTGIGMISFNAELK